MTPEEVTYLAVLLGSIPLGFAFKGRGPQARQLGGAAAGAALALATCGPHVLHSLLTVLGTWALLRLAPRRCGAAAMAWTFGYLLLFRTAAAWGLPEPPPYANALQLLLTLKMVSLASDVQELREAPPPPQEVTSDQLEPAIGSLEGCPGLLEILCYSYCYLGLLTGPFYRFGTHRDWVRGPVPAASWRRVLGRAGAAPALGALGEAAGRLFPLGAVRAPAFGGRPLPLRLFYMAPVFFAFRMRFYAAWLLAEAACLAAAFGAYPPAARPRPGQGPSAPYRRPRRAEEVPAELYDYETVRNIDPAGTDFCVRFRDGMRHWNMTVQWWLAHYVHRRAPRRPPALRSAWTMLVSAYWHGLHPGYYLSFLSVPLWLAAEAAAERALRGRLGPRGRALARGAHWFLKMRAYDYLCMGFVLLAAGDTLRYWRSVYYCLHLLPLLLLAAAALLGPGPGGDPDEPGGDAGGAGRRGEPGGPGQGARKPAPGDPGVREEEGEAIREGPGVRGEEEGEEEEEEEEGETTPEGPGVRGEKQEEEEEGEAIQEGPGVRGEEEEEEEEGEVIPEGPGVWEKKEEEEEEGEAIQEGPGVPEEEEGEVIPEGPGVREAPGIRSRAKLGGGQ